MTAEAEIVAALFRDGAGAVAMKNAEIEQIVMRQHGHGFGENEIEAAIG